MEDEKSGPEESMLQIFEVSVANYQPGRVKGDSTSIFKNETTIRIIINLQRFKIPQKLFL